MGLQCSVPKESLEPPSGFSTGKPSADSSSVFKLQSLTDNEKTLGFVWKSFPTGGPLGNQAVLWACAPQDSLITFGTFLGKENIPRQPCSFSTVCLILPELLEQGMLNNQNGVFGTNIPVFFVQFCSLNRKKKLPPKILFVDCLNGQMSKYTHLFLRFGWPTT